MSDQLMMVLRNISDAYSSKLYKYDTSNHDINMILIM